MQIIPLRQDNKPVMSFSTHTAMIEDAVFTEVSDNFADSRMNIVEKRSPFIEANTQEITLPELRKDFIPVFSKDNESSISHIDFIESIYTAVSAVFPRETLSTIECRVSHEVCGRIPSAVGKPTNQLEDWEKTRYFERLAFNIEVTSVYDVINGNELTLSVTDHRHYVDSNNYNSNSSHTFSDGFFR